MRAFWRIVLSVVREIADENAYQRHLRASGRQASAQEWRRFCDHRFARKYARAKCC